jgi:hypothetical protein
LSAIELEKYDRELEFWLSKSSDLQIQESDAFRYISDTKSFGALQDESKALGGFLTGLVELTQRIDFTQHCLSAYLQEHVDIDGQALSLD